MSDITESAAGSRRLPLGYYLAAAVPHVVLFLAILAAWELASILGWTNEVLVPRPSHIIAAIADLYIFQGTIYWHFLITMAEAVAGFTIAAIIGVSLAVASSISTGFRRYVSPYAIVLNVTPGLALTPIIIAWFGFGIGSKIALAAVISFFPIFVNTLTGLSRVDAEGEELFLSLRASRLQKFWKLRVPNALPSLFAGLKIAMTTALIGAVVAEFTQATEGVGVLMQRFSFMLDMSSSIATLLSMTAIGLTLFFFVEFLDDRFVYWRREARAAHVARKRAAAWHSRA